MSSVGGEIYIYIYIYIYLSIFPPHRPPSASPLYPLKQPLPLCKYIIGTLLIRALSLKYYIWCCQYCCSLQHPAESSQTVVMKTFAELPQTAMQCGSSSGSKTPCSSWQVIQSHSLDSCMLTAAPLIKPGDLSRPCVCPVGELWPRKYASDTFAVPVIESMPICLVMHMILKAQHCVLGH